MQGEAAETLDVVIAGAGPSGLAMAIECHTAGLRYVVFDKGCVVNSLFHFPTQIVYFTTPELLEIGNLPLVCAHEKPTRIEALKYYRRVVGTLGLRVRQYERVLAVAGQDSAFVVSTQREDGTPSEYQTRKIIVATGYYDTPKKLGIPGEELANCSHYFTEAHPFYDRDVAVIGAGNSGIEAALELYRGGARVTMVIRGKDVSESAKYWIKPDIQNRIKNGEIAALFESQVIEIRPASVIVRDNNTGDARELKNDFVFALTGYKPDCQFLSQIGIELAGNDRIPLHDPQSMETNVPGVYVIGAVVAGEKNNNVFIENGRFHGRQVIGALAAKLRGE